jgi:hypothetical protein
MNLRQGNGLVPIRVSGSTSPYLLVEFPDKGTFKSLYRASIADATVEKYWVILKARAGGATLQEAGFFYGLSKERVRQIEAKFLRGLAKLLDDQQQTSLKTD